MSLTQEEKQATWEVIEFFYPDFNPFANQFSANDVNEDVQRVVFEMSEGFSECAKTVVPLELMTIIMSITSAVNVKNIFDVISGFNQLNDSELGSLSYEACRNVQAASRRTDLYLAFIGFL